MIHFRHLISFLSLFISMVLVHFMFRYIDDASFFILQVAVTVVNMFSGFWMGVLTVLITSLGVAYYLPPQSSFLVADVSILILYVITSSVITYMVRALRVSEAHQNYLKVEKELREKFVSALSHDMRSPLTAAKASAEMIANHTDDLEKHKQLARIVLESIQRADRMITDLLDANRLGAGEKLPISVKEMNLCDAVRATLKTLSHVYPGRFFLYSETELRGYWDARGLQRLLENLAINAAKYGDSHAPISITIQRKKDLVEISVHNKGSPIPLEEQGRLFEQYRRTSKSSRGGNMGWGLGLAIVKGIAEAHGGQVQVKSNQDGTTFTVILPVDARVSSVRRFKTS